VTILRVVQPAVSDGLGFEGGVLETVVRPGPSLVAPED
jgi:hypothetical protein